MGSTKALISQIHITDGWVDAIMDVKKATGCLGYFCLVVIAVV